MTHAVRFFSLAVSMCALLSWAIPQARAQPRASKEDLAKARQHHKQGTEKFEAGDLEGAIVEFEAAYELSKAPGVLFNLATALLDAKRCREAAEGFEQFAKQAPDSPLHNEAIDQARKARECEREIARKRAAEAAAREARRQPLAAVPPPRPVEDDQARSASTLRWVGIGVGAAGLALAGTGVVFGLKANSDSDELSDRFADGGTWDADADALQDRYQRNKTLAYVFTSVGVAAALAGGGLLAWDLTRERPSRESHVSARISGTEQLLVWTLAFD